MKFGVVIFPGSNCDRDMIHVVGNVMEMPVRELWHKEVGLADLTPDDCIILPGGFSYGDYLRTGAIARFSPIMNAVIEHANKGGKVLGICNGFQILCEAGLLSGALVRNNNQRFICKNIHLKADNHKSLVNQSVGSEPLKIPIAHAEGRFLCQADTLREIEDEQLVLFRYCNEQGEVDESANPNGSLNNIAGITNKQRNVFGMMPHPERAAEPILGNSDGLAILQGLLEEVVV